ncbi:MAG: hypothetical protein C0183_16385 [Roseiflexus castenholzii]|nr:MAG: hypothetical protein C0183_16385 [Roseiflexus castenholzii]
MIGLRRALRPLKRANLFPILTHAARQIAQPRQNGAPLPPLLSRKPPPDLANNRRSPSAAGSFTAAIAQARAASGRSAVASPGAVRETGQHRRSS